jgi:hypothetical protein
MDVTDALDREVIIERAEAVRFWLLGFGLSNRATGAIQRELGAIIADDPGGYINGQRPLAGLTIADFINELHNPNGGAVGQVKSVGDAVLKELRAAIPADTSVASPAPSAVVEPPQAEPEAPQAAAPAEPRRRGRPKGSTKAAKNGVAPPQASPVRSEELSAAPIGDMPQAVEPVAVEPVAAEAPRRRGRPRRSEAFTPIQATARATNGTKPAASPIQAAQAPAATRAVTAPVLARATATASEADPSFDQLIRLWPSLHPHARRAVVLYAGDLLVEAPYKA